MSYKRQTDIAKGIFLFIAAFFLLLTLPLNRVGMTIFGTAVMSVKPGNKPATVGSAVIYLGTILALAGFLITTGMTFIKEEEEVST